MNGFGFFALGASAGMLTALILTKVRTPLNLGSIVATLLPVLASAAAVLLVPQLAVEKSAQLYAVGLFVSLLWQQTMTYVSVIDKPFWFQTFTAVFSFLAMIAVLIIAFC